MESYASIMGRGSPEHLPSENASPNFKTYGFVIALILGIGGLAVAGVGAAGYFHVGALSHLSQVHAIIMMAAGGGGGIVFLIIGIVGLVKNRSPAESMQAVQSLYNINQDVIRTIDTHGGRVYGPEAWKIWNVKIQDEHIPDASQVDNDGSKILLYIPETIEWNSHKNLPFNLATFIEMNPGPFEHISQDVREQLGNVTYPGWVLIDKQVIPESRYMNYEQQKELIHTRGPGYFLPTFLDAVVANMMVFAFTGKSLYGDNPLTYTHCSDEVEVESLGERHPVMVGGFGAAGLNITFNANATSSDNAYGVVSVLSFKQN